MRRRAQARAVAVVLAAIGLAMIPTDRAVMECVVIELAALVLAVLAL